MQDQAPIVGRPRGNAWRVLQADGIEWEGQVYLIGDQIDLATRMIVTKRRIAFIRGGGIALEADRSWLNPLPLISRLGDVTIFVDADGGGNPDRLRLQFRDGRSEATDLVRLLGGGPERLPVRRSAPTWERWDNPSFSWLDNNQPLNQPIETAPIPSTGWEAYDRPLANSASILESDDFPPIADVLPPASSYQPAPVVEEPIPPVPTGSLSALSPVDQPPTRLAPWLVTVDGLAIKTEKRSRRSMAIRLSGLAILLAAAAAFGYGKFPNPPSSNENLNAPTTAIETTNGIAPTATTSSEQQASLPDVSPDKTEVAQGVGGDNGDEIKTSETPTAESTVAAEEPTVAPTQAPDMTPTPQEAAQVQATTAATEAAAIPAGPTPPQGPSVEKGEIPAQVVVSNGFRYTVESAQRSADLSALNLPAVDYGDWVVVVLNAENWTADAAPLKMSDFSLQTTGPSGQNVPLDSGTEMVAQNLGLTPAYGASSSALFAGSEAHRIALVFLVTPDTEDIQLKAGDQSIDLAAAISAAVDPATLGDAPAASKMVEGTVTEVIDGDTFKVDAKGVTYTVRINGVAAPASGSCFADEATQSATDLLMGKTVWIERERQNLDDGGNLLRDVWVLNDGGSPTFAASTLATNGAAIVADTGEQNSRYAGWINAAAASAEASSTGLWGACNGDVAPADATAEPAGSAAASVNDGYTVSALPVSTGSLLNYTRPWGRSN
jgi:endonuclease YncB( thermonuclease family)